MQTVAGANITKDFVVAKAWLFVVLVHALLLVIF